LVIDVIHGVSYNVACISFIRISGGTLHYEYYRIEIAHGQVEVI